MTETEWLNSENPAEMLQSPLRIDDEQVGNSVKWSYHKKRMFIEACRQIVDHHYKLCNNINNENDIDELVSIWTRPSEKAHTGILPVLMRAKLLRDIIGNPFQPCTLTHLVIRPGGANDAGRPNREWRHGVQNWLTPQVLELAQAARDIRLTAPCKNCDGGKDEYYNSEPHMRDAPCYVCNGYGTVEDVFLDPLRLAILADALEEAGCVGNSIECRACNGTGMWDHSDFFDLTPEEIRQYGRPVSKCPNCQGTKVFHLQHSIIAHLRSVGPHTHGCHVLDLLLGLS